ncbi:MAG: MFS transporter [Gammaproteobacteria bacterium]|nr:MFS transporter [Gammaproteobacteria bacterium]
MRGDRDLPYWRLSSFYLLYFAALGALIPYFGLYLKSLGHAPAAIGTLMAVLMGTKIVAPNVWGWVADRRGERASLVRAGALLAAAGFAGVLAGSGFWWLAGVLVVFGFFWNSALPQFEAITLNHLDARAHRYTRIRLWGSIGFIASVVLVGRLLDAQGEGLLPYAVLVLLAGIWCASMLVREPRSARQLYREEGLRQVLGRPEVLALLAVCFLMQASHGPYYAFFSIYLQDHGYSRTLIGELWALGVLSEVVLFACMHRLFERWRLRALFLVCFALTGVRWIVVALFVDSLPLLVGAQVLHAASFGIYHAVAIQLVHRFFVGRHQGRGQALYSSMSFGAGGAAGSLASGYLWSTSGAVATWFAAAALSGVAFLIVWRWIGTGEAGEAAATRRWV